MSTFFTALNKKWEPTENRKFEKQQISIPTNPLKYRRAQYKGDRLFMTDPMSNTLYEFEGETESGKVKLLREVPVNTGCDNIEVISENEVLLGSHPQLYQLFVYFKDPEKLKSPSQIRRLKRTSEKEEWQLSDVFMDDGSLLSGSSVGVYAKDRLYIGSVIDKIVYCESKK